MPKKLKKLIKYNFSRGNKPQYLVIHDTGNSQKGANAQAHYRYFNGGHRGASAHYFVDDQEIIQVVEDHNASWHCGDGKGKYGFTNFNSLGIEICINEDGDYKQTLKNTLILIKHLQRKYKIADEWVVRHYDASRKICPKSMSANNWQKWWEFKERLARFKLEENENPEKNKDGNNNESKNKTQNQNTNRNEAENQADNKNKDKNKNKGKNISEQELQQAVKILRRLGILNSPEYWLENARKGKTVKGEYAASVLKRVITLCYK